MTGGECNRDRPRCIPGRWPPSRLNVVAYRHYHRRRPYHRRRRHPRRDGGSKVAACLIRIARPTEDRARPSDQREVCRQSSSRFQRPLGCRHARARANINPVCGINWLLVRSYSFPIGDVMARKTSNLGAGRDLHKVQCA